MLNEINSQKPKHDLSVKNNSSSNVKQSSQTVKPSVSAAAVQRSAASVPVSSMAAAAGLPQDKISSSIVSFARFFSLALKPQVLADIRRQAFLPAQQVMSANNVPVNQGASGDLSSSLTALKLRETFSLAAAAAESKGVELLPKGLELYAEAVDPEWEKYSDNEHHSRGKKQQEQKQQDKNDSGKAKSGSNPQAESVTAGFLQKMMSEYHDNNPLIEILNRLPAKNGKRWVVLPFNFDKDDNKINVSMRILIDEGFLLNQSACMALDISINNEHAADQRWVFAIEAAGNRPMRLTLYQNCFLAKKEQSEIIHELSGILEILPERISVKNTTESFPYEAAFDDHFLSVDEAV